MVPFMPEHYTFGIMVGEVHIKPIGLLLSAMALAKFETSLLTLQSALLSAKSESTPVT